MLIHHGVSFPIVAAGTGTVVEHYLSTLSNTNRSLTKMKMYSARVPGPLPSFSLVQMLPAVMEISEFSS